jgi:integral membrane protein (TIGR00529 family)
MQDLLRIVLVVLILLLLIKKKLDLGLVLFFGAVFSGLVFGLNLKALALNLFKVLISFETLSLIGIIVFVLYLGHFLQARGNFKILVDSLKDLIPEARLILAIPPAFIGLLPMLGGALMSAPIVEEAGRRWKLSPAWETFLNYWFRHIWEYCWPLYMNLIMAAAILKIPIKKISSVQFPFTILATILGLILLFKQVHYLPKERKSNRFLKNLFNLFFSLWPILLAIILIFALKLHMLYSLAITAFLTQVLSPMKIKERLNLIWKSISLKTIFLLASVMMFKKILEASGALSSLTQVFRPEGISAYFLLFVVPFFLGLLTGVNHAFVGISFPLLLPIFGLSHPDMVLVMFSYVSGFVGILLSPAHLCLILTVDYFQADLRDVYKILIWPCWIVFSAAFLVLLFLRIL